MTTTIRHAVPTDADTLVARLAQRFGALDDRTLFLRRAVDSGDIAPEALLLLAMLAAKADEEGVTEFDGETYQLDLGWSEMGAGQGDDHQTACQNLHRPAGDHMEAANE